MNPTEPFLALEFHEKFSLPIQETIGPVDKALVQLRLKLIREEFEEVRAELRHLVTTEQQEDEDFFRLAKELADLKYVIDGTAVTFGINLNEVMHEVHRSNMSKLDDNGEPVYRSDGKVTKSRNYKPPKLTRELCEVSQG